MKKCEICSAPATVFLTRVVNGQATKFCLCIRCAQEKGFIDPHTLEMNPDMLPGLSDVIKHMHPPVATPVPNISTTKAMPIHRTECPACGFTLEQFYKTGRLGCSTCYDVFKAQILPLFREGKITLHTDEAEESTPAEQPSSQQNTEQPSLERLEKQLAKAVKAEDYELAAELRDKINTLRTQQQGEG